MAISIVSAGPDDWSQWRELRLCALAESPDAFCSSIEDWQSIGEHSWRSRLDEIPVNLMAELDGRRAGMVSAVASPDENELIEMWVAPFARGRGVGDALVSAVIAWSDARAPRLVLSILRGNVRAESLYRRHGFEFAETAGQDDVRELVMVHAVAPT